MATALLVRPAALAAFNTQVALVGRLMELYEGFPEAVGDDLPVLAAAARQLLEQPPAGRAEASLAVLMLVHGPLMAGPETLPGERDTLLTQLTADLASEGYPAAILFATIDKLRRTKSWMPPLAEIREACRKTRDMVESIIDFADADDDQRWKIAYFVEFDLMSTKEVSSKEQAFRVLRRELRERQRTKIGVASIKAHFDNDLAFRAALLAGAKATLSV